MGLFLSSARNSEYDASIGNSDSTKRPRISVKYEHQPATIPGLPEEIAVQILARVSRGNHPLLSCVCKAWYHVLSTPEFFNLRKELGVTEEWLYVLMKDEEERLGWRVLDPVEGRWRKLPPMPELSNIAKKTEANEISWGWRLRSGPLRMLRLTSLFGGWFQRKGFLDKIPYCGCSAGAINGSLYVLGGFSWANAMRAVWRYDSRTNRWASSAAMEVARAYCKTGVIDNKLYAIGGVDRGRGGLTPLQSAEVYDPETDSWSQVAPMPFRRARVLPTAFLSDMLKPIATGMASYNGKLCVPQSLYSWPFFVDVGGEIFDPATDTWVEMATGMGNDWPARQAGTKLSAVVGGKLYALDPTSSMDGSKIKVYDSDKDVWKVVLKKVPILLDLSDSESPYLLAGFDGKLHVITKDFNNNVTVLRAELGFNSQSHQAKEFEVGWKTISSASFGAVELVACQVLDL
ncbi:F-box/kelch-repeat protein At1g22040 [Physcomitrium patens]|uniref:F-box domain-containing protein n=1 Tax=Physcomitrium patens TaxID=3218 RepID=A9S662_PHYPA|nr:F-box/kelch-repeat protein At1g22040-like [Physcomitrium patens]XP_024387517.1 F-box/kelch-repeat protein At1g22040-like [Physcomitrium patens]XP_024387518.1 F-box/kelch-repeat protein At1g22040-like [Physcomitrium patens]XP_024387519.1 F-box/kelch-repeat protein At1g22040-like [Physcomitrium patens]PNR46328.1 hypothetical protein PHYPA_013447 [Physcomitrium patens]|eukprot:XP_024387516.1 F-box/kelch-repeat protein At1g22040-like [Physcomitrella patens]